jgi:hypothetical protein
VSDLRGSRFPEDPRERKVIVVLEQSRRDSLQGIGSYERLERDGSAHILELPVQSAEADLTPVLQRLMRRDDFRSGATYLQSPFDAENYFDLDAFSQEVARRKIRITTELSRRLGASRVHITEATEESIEGRSRFRWSADAPAVPASGHIKGSSTDLDLFMRSVNIIDRFSGGEADVDAAAVWLRQNRVDEDDELQELIALRTGDNPLLSREMVVVTRHEIEAASKRVATVKAALGKVRAEWSRTTSDLAVYSFNLTIEF